MIQLKTARGEGTVAVFCFWTMAIKHVLFDNDGTVVDSEIIAARATLSLLAQHGLHLDEHDYNIRFPGLRTREIIAVLQAERGFEPPPDFLLQVQAGHTAAYALALKAIVGMPALFKKLKVPKSMVSNGSLKHVEDCLRWVGLWDAVDGQIFSAEQVDKPKPSPDIYLFALEKLGISAHETVVVEDSVTGILSAKSAGIQTIGFLGASHISIQHGHDLWEAGADFVVPDATALTALLKKKGAC